MRINGRTLAQIIDQVSAKVPETTFYVGSGEGSGFVFIGDADKFHEDVDRLSKHWKETMRHLRDQKRTKIKSIASDILHAGKKETDEYVSGSLDSIERNLELYKTYTDAFNNWQNFDVRIPRRSYVKDKRLDPNGLIIIVPGVENGGYWFPREYDFGRENNFATQNELTMEEDK